MEYIIKCKKCGKEFKINCSENNYKKEKYSHYCSFRCRNSHNVSNETKQKISKSLKLRLYGAEEKICKCECCGKEFIKNGKSKFCSNECKALYKRLPTFIKYFGLNKEYIRTEKVFEEVNKIKQMLYDDYWNNNLTSKDIGEKYNYPSSCNITGKIFNYLNIPTRNCKDTIILNYEKGKIPVRTSPIYKSEWHTTWDNKEVFLRSSYEIDYANELDKNKILYDAESLRIKYWNSKDKNYHCAIPDFYLPDTNTIVEIKSEYTLNIQEMKDKVKAYKELGYNFKLILEHQETDLEALL